MNPPFHTFEKPSRNLETFSKRMKNLQEVFPKGIAHLQVSERREAKNIKELIAPSTMKFKEGNDAEQTNENSEEALKGSYPCGKERAYCQPLSKSQGQTFQSNSNKKIFKVC